MTGVSLDSLFQELGFQIHLGPTGDWPLASFLMMMILDLVVGCSAAAISRISSYLASILANVLSAWTRKLGPVTTRDLAIHPLKLALWDWLPVIFQPSWSLFHLPPIPFLQNTWPGCCIPGRGGKDWRSRMYMWSIIFQFSQHSPPCSNWRN